MRRSAADPTPTTSGTEASPPALPADRVRRFRDRVLRWGEANRRTFPWRLTRDPWRVLVSEVMLQQTPVGRVLPVYQEWMERWPAAKQLAGVPVGEAVRAWGRLGYPRRLWRGPE